MEFKRFLEALYPDNTFVLLIGRAANSVHKADEEDIFDASDSITTNTTKTYFADFGKALKAFHDVMFQAKKELEVKDMPISSTDKTLIVKNHASSGIVHVSLALSYGGKQNDIAWWNRGNLRVSFGPYLNDKPKVKAYLQFPSIHVPNSMDSYAKWKQDVDSGANQKTFRK